MLLDELVKLSASCEPSVAGPDRFIFTCFHDKEKSKDARQPTGTYKETQEQLKALNERGYGIFFGVNHFQATKRANDQVDHFRCIWQDDDNHYAGDYPIPPSWVVESSPGKFQRYWFIDPKTAPSREEWSAVQRNMPKWGCDKNAVDPARILRVPGFNHCKQDPVLVKEVEDECTGVWYSWQELKDAFGPSVDEASKQENVEQGASYIAQAMEAIRTGENYNGSLTTISQSYANSGMPKEMIEILLNGLMQTAVTKDDRWEQRVKHIPIYAQTAVEKAQRDIFQPLDEVPDVPDAEIILPWPPGYLGELAKSAYIAQHYQNQTVAIATAIATVAGVCGRKFNVSGTGLNVYVTILMESGMGKDSIADFIHKFMMQFNELGNASAFIGKKRYTGPKALADDLHNQRCILSVFTEAGYMFKSSAGDQDGMVRAILDLYTKSGQYSFATGESYSDSKNSIPTIRAPSLSIMNEATPETLLKVLQERNSAVTGELPRMSIFRVYGDKPYLNTNARFSISQELRTHFGALLRQCLPTVVADDPEAVELQMPSESFDYARMCVDLENEFRHSDPVKSKMNSRRHVKCLKLAAICAVMNPNTPEGQVGPDDWQWAKDVCSAEMEGIENLQLSGGSGLDDAVVKVLVKTIAKLLKNEYRNERTKLKPEHIRDKIIPYAVLYQVLKNNAVICSLTTSYQPGLVRALDFAMEQYGLLRIVGAKGVVNKSDGRVNKSVYQVIPGVFNDLLRQL